MKRQRTALVLALVLLLSFTLGNMKATAATVPENRSLLQVNGNAVITVKPDTALITLGVDTSSSSAEVAAQENADRMAKVLAALKELGLSDSEIATKGYNIYSYDQYLGRTTGEDTVVTTYQVQNRIQITTKNLELVGQIVDAAVKAGANQVQGVSFDLADKEELQLQALKNAIKQAQTKAEAMAEGAGVQLGGIAKITEEYGSYVPLYGAMLAKEFDQASSTEINPGEVEITARVLIEFWF